jgi:hypothetical protein
MEAATDEPMGISHAASPPATNLLPDNPDGVVEEAFAAAAQTEARINASAEELPIVRAYPGSPVRSVVLFPWEVVDELPQLGQRQESLCQSQGQQLGNPSPAPEGTSPSSIIVEAPESSEQLAEDVASDVDADGEADLDPAPAASGSSIGLSAPLVAGLLAPPVVTVVPRPQPLKAHTPARTGASAASGMTIDARLISPDEALVDLWVCTACPLVLHLC